MTLQELQQKLTNGLPNAKIELSGDGCNCSVIVVSENFEGVSLLNRQKMVLAVVKDEIASGELHALSIKAKTPNEYKQL